MIQAKAYAALEALYVRRYFRESCRSAARRRDKTLPEAEQPTFGWRDVDGIWYDVYACVEYARIELL